MKVIKYIFGLTLLFSITSCDPVFDLKLGNQTNQKIEVIYYPLLDTMNLEGHQQDTLVIGGKEMYKVILNPQQTISIGRVYNRNTPASKDLYLDHLEVKYGNDIITLNGKNEIFTKLQKVDKLDWRIQIK